jgi:hypothetical protein
VDYLNDNKGKDFKFEPLKAGKIEVEPGVKFSATQMRKAISEGDFDTFKTFMPEKLSDDETKEIFKLLGGGIDEAAAMAGGAVVGQHVHSLLLRVKRGANKLFIRSNYVK